MNYMYCLLLCSFLCGCRPVANHQFSSISAEINQCLLKHYMLEQRLERGIQRDSLRATFFYSPALKRVAYYGYYGRTDSVNTTIKPQFAVNFYEYSNKDTARKIIAFILKENQKRLQEGEYGLMGKNFQYVVQGAAIILHFEAMCKTAEQAEWLNIEDSINYIAQRYFSNTYVESIKPCE